MSGSLAWDCRRRFPREKIVRLLTISRGKWDSQAKRRRKGGKRKGREKEKKGVEQLASEYLQSRERSFSLRIELSSFSACSILRNRRKERKKKKREGLVRKAAGYTRLASDTLPSKRRVLLCVPGFTDGGISEINKRTRRKRERGKRKGCTRHRYIHERIDLERLRKGEHPLRLRFKFSVGHRSKRGGEERRKREGKESAVADPGGLSLVAYPPEGPLLLLLIFTHTVNYALPSEGGT